MNYRTIKIGEFDIVYDKQDKIWDAIYQGNIQKSSKNREEIVRWAKMMSEKDIKAGSRKFIKYPVNASVFSDSFITKEDYKGAKLTLKHSTNPKEIEKAQEVIRKYRETNPESAAKIDEELAKGGRKPRGIEASEDSLPENITGPNALAHRDELKAAIKQLSNNHLLDEYTSQCRKSSSKLQCRELREEILRRMRR